MSTKISIQNTGELEQLRLDLGVQSIVLQAPSTNTEDCTKYEMYSEERKQCMCEHDPANCPDDVLYFFHSDQLGSSSYLTDADGNPYQFFIYLPWGEVLAEQKAAEFSTPYQFNGKELDQETGLYNYGARYYDPSLSVWLGVDPLADKFYSWSPYHYATNNPINIIDYDGRDTLGPTGAKWDQRASDARHNIGEGLIRIKNSLQSAKNWISGSSNGSSQDGPGSTQKTGDNLTGEGGREIGAVTSEEGPSNSYNIDLILAFTGISSNSLGKNKLFKEGMKELGTEEVTILAKSLDQTTKAKGHVNRTINAYDDQIPNTFIRDTVEIDGIIYSRQRHPDENNQKSATLTRIKEK